MGPGGRPCAPWRWGRREDAGTGAKSSPEPCAQGALGLGTDGKRPWPWGRRGESEPPGGGGGLRETLGQGPVNTPSGRAAVTPPEVISSSRKLLRGNLGPRRSCESEVELEKGSLSLPQGLARSKTRAQCPPPGPRCPPPVPVVPRPSDSGDPVRLWLRANMAPCAAYTTKAGRAVFPERHGERLPGGSLGGEPPGLLRKSGERGLEKKGEATWIWRRSHEAILKWPLLPAPVTGDSSLRSHLLGLPLERS